MATSENYLKFINDYKNKIKDKINKKEIFNYNDFELIEEKEINKLLADAFNEFLFKIEALGSTDFSSLEYLSALQKTNKDVLNKIEIQSVGDLYIGQVFYIF